MKTNLYSTYRNGIPSPDFRNLLNLKKNSQAIPLQDTNKTNPPIFQENLQIPLINGNIMNIPLTSINISEEVNKTGIWKQVNNSNKLKSHIDTKELKVKSAKKT